MRRPIVIVCFLVCIPTGIVRLEIAADPPRSKGEFVVDRWISSPIANQAVAADETHIYAIDNTVVSRINRETGRELGRSVGAAKHLNSGFLWNGKLYCAHSNFPRTPHQSDIRVVDPDTMKLEIFHIFENPPGSLTWAIRRDDQWWCHFAHYGADNDKSVLIQYADGWKEIGRWTYPRALVAEWGAYSLSGGIWHGDSILATGHDKKVLYRLRAPATEKVVDWIETIASPFPGQGIASDPKTGGLVGIDRGKRHVVFAKWRDR